MPSNPADRESGSPRFLALGMHFDASGGGVDRYFSGLLRGMDSIGADFTAAAFGDPGCTGPSRISLGPAETSVWHRRAALRKLGRGTLKSERVVATHFALYAYPVLRALRRKTHVVHFHGPWAEESAVQNQKPWVVAAKRLIERRVYASAGRLIVLSEAFREILIRKYRVPASRIRVIPGGVDIDQFRPSPDRAESRRRLGWPLDKKIVLCVRRLIPRMGIETLIKAFAQTAAGRPEAILIVAGKGAQEHDLRIEASELGLGERMLFAGFIPDSDLPDAYAAADFSIVPSQALEGFGLVTVESLACGRPVLVTPIGGLPETVRALDPSLIMDGCDVEALTAGLRRGFSQPLPSPAECRNYVMANFAWPVIARQVLTIYEEAMSDSLC